MTVPKLQPWQLATATPSNTSGLPKHRHAAKTFTGWEYFETHVWHDPPLAHLTILGLDDVASIACAPVREHDRLFLEWDAAPAVRFEPKRVAQPKGARRLFGKRWAT